MKKNGLTFDTLYELFEEVCKNYLSIQMPENADELFPSIDYDLYPHTNNIKRFIENKKIVLICNGKALSGQAGGPIKSSLSCKKQAVAGACLCGVAVPTIIKSISERLILEFSMAFSEAIAAMSIIVSVSQT